MYQCLPSVTWVNRGTQVISETNNAFRLWFHNSIKKSRSGSWDIQFCKIGVTSDPLSAIVYPRDSVSANELPSPTLYISKKRDAH